MSTKTVGQREISLINYDLFIGYLKEVFQDNPYAFEIFATDMWCLKDDTEYETVFITRAQNDKGIDSIVVPTANRHYRGRHFFLIQVSLGSKFNSSLVSFLTRDASHTYPTLIPQEAKCKRVVVALGRVRCSDPDVEILSGHKLAELMVQVCTRYSLLDIRSGKLSQRYVANILCRAELWEDAHDTRDSLTISRLSKLFTMFHTSIRNDKLDIPLIINEYVKGREDRILRVTSSPGRETFMVHFQLKAASRGVNMDNSKRLLALLVGEQLGYDSGLVIAPTKRYLTIKLPDSNVALAHLDWSYDSPQAQHCIFGFKCEYEEVSHLDLRLKPIEAVNNHLHFKMKTALTDPSLHDGLLIQQLALASQTAILGTHM